MTLENRIITDVEVSTRIVFKHLQERKLEFFLLLPSSLLTAPLSRPYPFQGDLSVSQDSRAPVFLASTAYKAIEASNSRNSQQRSED